MLDRSVTDEAYVPEPFPEVELEPLEWVQILATLDVCVNDVNPTNFCDEQGFDIVPFQMMNVINEQSTENSKKQNLSMKLNILNGYHQLW